MPSSSQMTPSASCSLRRVASGATRPCAPASARPAVTLSLMSVIPPGIRRYLTARELSKGNGQFRTRTGYCLNPAGVLGKPGPGICHLVPEWSAAERRVAAADRGGPSFGLFPVFLAAQGGQVEEGVGAAEDLGAPGKGRVGVEDFLALAQEAAEAGPLAGLAAGDGVRFGT